MVQYHSLGCDGHERRHVILHLCLDVYGDLGQLVSSIQFLDREPEQLPQIH